MTQTELVYLPFERLMFVRDLDKNYLSIQRSKLVILLPRSMGKSTGPQLPVPVAEHTIDDPEILEALDNGFSILVLFEDRLNGIIRQRVLEPLNFGTFTWEPDLETRLNLKPSRIDVIVAERKVNVAIGQLAVGQPNANGRIYPKEVLEKAMAGKQHVMKDGKLVGEVKDGEVYLSETLHRDILAPGHSFSIRGFTNEKGELGEITCWNLISENTLNKTDIEFQAVYQLGASAINFAERWMQNYKDDNVNKFKAENYLLFNQQGDLVGYISKAEANEKVGRGMSNPSMSIDWKGNLIACHGGQAYLNGEHILPSLNTVIAVTYGDNDEPLYLTNPKIQNASLSGSSPK